MNENVDRTRRRGGVRSLVNHLEQHMRLQRELFWHPRLGLPGARRPAPVRVAADARRSSTRR
jgi:hypothetical protein